MGRSVDYLSNALYIAYFDTNASEYENEEGEIIQPDEWDYQQTFEDFVENMKYAIKAKFKSIENCDKWDGRETNIVLENSLCEIGISEYCGLTSLSIRVNDYAYDRGIRGLAEKWIHKNWNRILKSVIENTYHECYTKIGSFSNGEGLFQKLAS